MEPPSPSGASDFLVLCVQVQVNLSGKPSVPYSRGAGSTLQISFCFLSVLEFLEPAGIVSGHICDFIEGSLPVATGFDINMPCFFFLMICIITYI